MTYDLSKWIVQAIYTIKPEMLKWSPEANQLKLGIRRVKQWWETWWNERFSKSTVYTMGVKACTQQMSWGNIKHFFSISKANCIPLQMSFFFLFSQSGHENWVCLGASSALTPKYLLLKWIFAPVQNALRPFFLSDKSCHYNFRLQNMRKTKHLCSQPRQKGSGSTPGLPSTLHACLQRVNAM